jgi:hypothetical protein
MLITRWWSSGMCHLLRSPFGAVVIGLTGTQRLPNQWSTSLVKMHPMVACKASSQGMWKWVRLRMQPSMALLLIGCWPTHSMMPLILQGTAGMILMADHGNPATMKPQDGVIRLRSIIQKYVLNLTWASHCQTELIVNDKIKLRPSQSMGALLLLIGMR